MCQHYSCYLYVPYRFYLHFAVFSRIASHAHQEKGNILLNSLSQLIVLLRAFGILFFFNLLFFFWKVISSEPKVHYKLL